MTDFTNPIVPSDDASLGVGGALATITSLQAQVAELEGLLSRTNDSLLHANRAVESMREAANKKARSIAAARDELQEKIDNYISESSTPTLDEPFFSINEVNELLGAAYADLLKTVRTFVVEATVKIDVSLRIEAKDEDEARDMAEDILGNLDFERPLSGIDEVDGSSTDVDIDDVTEED